MIREKVRYYWAAIGSESSLYSMPQQRIGWRSRARLGHSANYPILTPDPTGRRFTTSQPCLTYLHRKHFIAEFERLSQERCSRHTLSQPKYTGRHGGIINGRSVRISHSP